MQRLPGNLILSRRHHEAIVLVDAAGIEVARVSIAGIEGNRVRLAIAAAPSISIARGEVAGRWQPRPLAANGFAGAAAGLPGLPISKAAPE